MDYELTRSMFKVTSIFSLISIGKVDVLALGNPFKERDIWEGKVDALELRCTNFMTEILTLLDEDKATHSLCQQIKIHGSLLTLAAFITELEGSLKDAEERYKFTSDFVEEKAFQVEKYQK